MLIRITIIGAGLLALVGAAGFLLPSDATVERTVHIDAPPATVFTMLNGYHQFSRWSPWLSHVPGNDLRFSGPLQGVGARLEWDDEKGTATGGSETIVVSEPWRRIEVSLDLDAERPARSWYQLRADDGGTLLTWGYATELGSGPFTRYWGPVIEHRVAAALEEGSGRLRSLAERVADVDFSESDLALVEREAWPVLWTPVESRPQPEAVSEALGDAYYRITRLMREQNIRAAGPPMARLRSMSGRARIDAAIPLPASAEVRPDPRFERIHQGRTPAGTALQATHIGPYRTLGSAHAAARAWLRAAGLRREGDPWEVYVSDPAGTPEQELETRVYYFIAGASTTPPVRTSAGTPAPAPPPAPEPDAANYP